MFIVLPGKFPKTLDAFIIIRKKTETNMASSGALLVAAIDFGTTFSGWAYSFLYEFRSDPTKVKVKHWYPDTGFVVTEKTPTCALIKPDGKTLQAFGYEAENAYTELKDDERKTFYYFRRFKMALDKKKISRSLTIQDEMGKSLPAIEVFKMSIQFLSQNLLNECSNALAGELTMDDICWVLTVPAIWSDGAKQFMREAAEKAGLKADKLLIALEPEVASVFCRHLPVERLQGNNSISNLPSGTKYMVLDAGGGTVDITVHQVTDNGGLKEITAASGGGWGGTLVDQAFKDLLINLFTKDVYDRFVHEEGDDWIVMWRTFESKKKAIRKAVMQFSSLFETYKNAKGCEFKDTLARSEYSSRITARGRDKLEFDQSIMEGLFARSIDATLSHVKSILHDEKAKGISAILMVGGFSEAGLLQEAFKKEFQNRINIVVPSDTTTCILRGAVMYGHNPMSISQRVLRKTYGVGTSVKFQNGVHPENLKQIINGTEICGSVFAKHVEVNQVVNVGEAQDQKFYESFFRGQTEIKFPVYASNEKNPKYTNQGCYQLGSLTVDISSVWLHKIRKGVKVGVSLTFSGTEVEATAYVKETGEITSATFDFLE